MKRRTGLGIVGGLAVAFMLVASPAEAEAQVTIFSENFDGLAGSLQPAVEEPNAPAELLGWTHTPPAGWINDNSGVPGVGDPATDGRAEWAGWSFTTMDFWLAADGQRRDEFTKSSGVFAVADPDEWDDASHPGGPPEGPWFNAFLTTAQISLVGMVENTATLTFDSSWRPEFDTNYHQTANITVSYDGGSSTQVLLWESDGGGDDFHGAATNESVIVDLANPAGATNMVLTFGLFDAGNDWWWAVDNIAVSAVPEPATLALLAAGGLALVRRRRRA